MAVRWRRRRPVGFNPATRIAHGVFQVVRVLSLVFDLMFFSSLAILILGAAENKFAFLPITFVLIGIIVQAILLRRFRLSQQQQWHFPTMRPKKTAAVQTKVCPDCNRAISADAKICRFCLTEVDQHFSSSGQIVSQVGNQDLQLQTERWRAATTANV